MGFVTVTVLVTVVVAEPVLLLVSAGIFSLTTLDHENAHCDWDGCGLSWSSRCHHCFIGRRKGRQCGLIDGRGLRGNVQEGGAKSRCFES